MNIAEQEIGTGRTFVIYESCSNHFGRLGLLRKQVLAAAQADCDAFKIQRFHVEHLRTTGRYDEPTLALLKGFQLKPDWIREIAYLTKGAGMAFIATPFDEQAVEELTPYVDAWKIRHVDYVNRTLRNVIKTCSDKPMIQSVPADTWWKLAAKPTGDEGCIYLYCNPQYPTRPEDVHLPVFWRYTGFSDHTPTTTAGGYAVLRGAVVVEKHGRILPRHDTGLADDAVSLPPNQFAEYVRNVRDAELMMLEPSAPTGR